MNPRILSGTEADQQARASEKTAEDKKTSNDSLRIPPFDELIKKKLEKIDNCLVDGKQLIPETIDNGSIFELAESSLQSVTLQNSETQFGKTLRKSRVQIEKIKRAYFRAPRPNQELGPTELKHPKEIENFLKRLII